MQAIMKAGGSNSHDHLGVGVLQPRGEKYQPILNRDLFFELPGLTSVQGYVHTLSAQASGPSMILAGL